MWLVYMEAGEYTDYTFSPIGIYSTAESAKREFERLKSMIDYAKSEDMFYAEVSIGGVTCDLESASPGILEMEPDVARTIKVIKDYIDETEEKTAALASKYGCEYGDE